MAGMKVHEPKQRISKEASKVWLWSDTIANLIGGMIVGIIYALYIRFGWKEWVFWLIAAIAALVAIGIIWSYIQPFLLYKNWRYDADQEFLHMKNGALQQVDVLVPMTKIQSVATKQGIFMRKYNLMSVSVQTIGGEHVIPALPKERAEQLRNAIAVYAKVKDDE